MSRVIWVQSHPRRLPDRVDTPPHREMLEARIYELCAKAIEAALATLTAEQLEEVR